MNQNYHHQSQQQMLNRDLNFPDFTTTNQPPTYLQANYSSQLTSPYALDMNQLSPQLNGGMDFPGPASARDNHQTKSLQLNPSNQNQNFLMQQMSQSSSHRSSQSSQQQSLLDEQRKQDILARLQQEREMRRRMIQEGGSVQTAAFINQSSMDGPSYNQPTFAEPARTPSSQSIASSQQLQQKKDIVNRLLNERRLNRSGQNSQHSMQVIDNHSSGGEDQPSNFGGFNPEALYQEDAMRECSQQDSHRQNSRQSQQQHQEEEIEDERYRQAVAYARSQIESDRQKRLQELQHLHHNESRGSSSNSQQNRYNSRSQSLEHQRQQSAPQLPPNVYQMERALTQKSSEKHILEMNSKPQRGKHHFTYESEDEQQKTKSTERAKKGAAKVSEERGFKKVANAKTQKGEYMKATVNADLKKQGPAPSIAKTQHIISEAEKKFKEEHTFRPQVREYPLPPSKEVSKEERWKKLTEPKTLELQKRERIRAQLEIEETQKTCPFKPSIAPTSTKSGCTSTSISQYDTLPLPERLLHEADLRKEKREKLKREMEMEQMKECSFKPRILSQTGDTSNSTMAVVNLDKLHGREPIHQRVQGLQKEKNEKLQKLRMKSEHEQQSEYTFQPSVNKKSSKIAIIKQSQEQCNSVVDRLYRDANDRIEKQMSHNVSVNEQANKDYSFHPHISKSSTYMSAQSDMYSGNLKDFHERQEAFIKRQLEKREEARKKWADEERFAFKPEINATSEVICESDPSRGGENEHDLVERLYKRDSKKQEVVREMIEKEVYSQYTYKPEINKVSKAIARNSNSIDELAYNPRGREKREQLQEQLITQEFSDCTFQPQTTKSKKYQNVTSTYSVADCSTTEEYSRKLKEKLKEKQERIAQERREREYDQLKDCTFHPKILDKEPVNNENVKVKGLQRHLELKELKKKQEEEKRLREAEVFGLNHKFAVNVEDLDISKLSNGVMKGKPTSQKPFELTNAGKLDEKRRAALLKELKEKEMSECTFKPSTNEGRNKKIINELLSQIDDNSMVQYKQHQFKDERGVSNDEKENYYAMQMTTENTYYQ